MYTFYTHCVTRDLTLDLKVNPACSRNITLVFRRVRKTTKSDDQLRHVCPSAWNNSVPTGRILMKFYMSIFFFKSVYKIQVSLKFGNNNGCLTRTSIHIFDQISSTSSYNEKCFRNKLQSKSKHAFYVQKNFFSPENLAFFFEMM